MKRYLAVDDQDGIILVEGENGKLNKKIKLVEIDANGIPVKPLEAVNIGKKNISFDNNLREKQKPEYDTKLNLFEWLKAKYFHIKREGEFQMFEAIKKIIIPKITQWILKIAGSILAYLGISSSTVEEIIAGIVVFGLSALWSLITTGKIALTDPKEFLKLK